MGFFWNKSQPVAEAKQVEAKQPDGFFSTSAPDLYMPRAAMIAKAIARTFLRTPKDFVVTGGATGQDAVAMDCDDLSVKQAYQMAQQNIPDAQFAWFASQGFIGHQTAAMIAQHWLVDKACSMPAKDAVRKGYEITVNNGTKIDPAIFDEMIQIDKRMQINDQMMDFVRTGRIFGIRIAMFLVDSTDPEYYTKPFNIDGVTPGSYRGITQIDPYWVAPELSMSAASDPSAKDFYEPTWWRIKGQRVHRSHLRIFRNGTLPDILKPSYMYGGIPVPQKIAERVYCAERTANEAPQLAMTKRTNAVHCDVAHAMANQDKFEERMNQWAFYRDNYGIKVLGADETMEQFDTALGDLDAVIMTQYQLVAAASNVPATKLLGTSPKGFGASGEYEESSYHEELESIQSHDLTPFLDRHHQLVIRSMIAPHFGIKPFDVSVTWKPLDSMTAKEQAEVNKLKAESDAVLIQSGAIDGEDIRHRIIADPHSGYSGIEDAAPEADLGEETAFN